MKVKIKKLHKDAKIPECAYQSDYGYDCYAISEKEIAPNVWKYGLGIALQIKRDSNLKEQVKVSIELRARSSIYKTGMIIANGVGTIDESYTGEISTIMYHVNPELPRYKVGDKVCQLMLNITMPLDFEEVDTIYKTQRGEGGFGSTDK